MRTGINIIRANIHRLSPMAGALLLSFILGILMLPLPGNGETDVQPEFQWPLVKGEYPDLEYITSTFGESRIDHFHSGLDIAGNNDAIYPVAAGEIVFSRMHGDDPFHPMQGPGNYLFLHHEGDWWSGYYHLKAFDEEPRTGTVGPETVIGHSSNSGHSGGPHLHFFMSTEYGQRIMNPLVLLPPVTDIHPPVIGPLVIVSTDERRTHIQHSETQNIRLTQPYPIQIQLHDPGLEAYTRRGVYILEWQLNDEPAQTRRFDYIEFKNGDWRLHGEQAFDEVFRYNQYSLGELNWLHGGNRLHVKAVDLNCNVTEVDYFVNVDREY